MKKEEEEIFRMWLNDMNFTDVDPLEYIALRDCISFQSYLLKYRCKEFADEFADEMERLNAFLVLFFPRIKKWLGIVSPTLGGYEYDYLKKKLTPTPVEIIIDTDEDEDGTPYEMEIKCCPTCHKGYRFYLPQKCERCGQRLEEK